MQQVVCLAAAWHFLFLLSISFNRSNGPISIEHHHQNQIIAKELSPQTYEIVSQNVVCPKRLTNGNANAAVKINCSLHD